MHFSHCVDYDTVERVEQKRWQQSTCSSRVFRINQLEYCRRWVGMYDDFVGQMQDESIYIL